MKSSILATLLILSLSLSLHSFPSGVAADAIDDSCNAIRDFVDVAFCAAALRSNPKSSSADRLGHLLISVELSIANGTSTKAAVDTLSKSEPDAGVKNSLEACGILYGTSVSALQLMRDSVAAKSWPAAHSLLLLTGQAWIGCNAALGAAAAARLAEQNKDFDQLTTMVTALLNNLTGVRDG